MVISWLSVAATAFIIVAIFSASGTAAWYALRQNGGVFVASFLWSFLVSFLWIGIVVENEPAVAALLPHAFSVHLLAGCLMAGSFSGFAGTQYGEGTTLLFTGVGAVVVLLIHAYLLPFLGAGWLYNNLLVVL